MSEIQDKRKATIAKKYGSYEAYLEALKKWTSKGGKKTSERGGGFKAFTPEERSKAGKKGVVAMRAKLKAELLQEIRDENK